MIGALLTIISIHLTLFVVLVIWLEYQKFKNRKNNE